MSVEVEPSTKVPTIARVYLLFPYLKPQAYLLMFSLHYDGIFSKLAEYRLNHVFVGRKLLRTTAKNTMPTSPTFTYLGDLSFGI